MGKYHCVGCNEKTIPLPSGNLQEGYIFKCECGEDYVLCEEESEGRWWEHVVNGDRGLRSSAVKPDERPTRDMIFMEMAHVIRKRSTCSRGSVGAVAVLDQRVLATGYNGSPPGAPHCTELGCLLEDNHHETGCQRAIHCEANLIAWAARHGIALRGATLYCTHGPCLKCAQLILSAGFTRVVYGVPYRLPDGLRLLLHSTTVAEQFDQEYVQLLAGRHHAFKPPTTQEIIEAKLPTECQAAEAKYYGDSEDSREGDDWGGSAI